MNIECTPGKTSVFTDALSMSSVHGDTDCDVCSFEVTLFVPSGSDIRTEQIVDSELAHVISTLNVPKSDEVKYKN